MLKVMTNHKYPTPDDLPDHPLFSTHGWRYMLRMTGGSFDWEEKCFYQEGGDTARLSVQAHLKNYDDEIEKFIDWIMPWIAAEEGSFLGYYIEESDQVPAGPVYIYKK